MRPPRLGCLVTAGGHQRWAESELHCQLLMGALRTVGRRAQRLDAAPQMLLIGDSRDGSE